ncbi:protein mono-ADP-ribosyltransferase PARP3 isoform X2 [Falco biarmicus]|uniref:protein mono-ADP-ribosyltransferase PARP3 isoform X2 n=2 Tax=Falco TaxID=8952 RepID=UPI0024BD14BA|nr:protein mono-ADP-ribosyltransferase PARP3 isoform X2 [Falco biarmicus]
MCYRGCDSCFRCCPCLLLPKEKVLPPGRLPDLPEGSQRPKAPWQGAAVRGTRLAGPGQSEQGFAGGLRLHWPHRSSSAMALKRHALALKQPDHREKKVRGGEEEDTWSSTLAALKTAPKEKPPAIIDGLCPLSTALGALVYEDYDCTLNQTNINANNNKFYIIQLIEHDGAYSVWTRWGRVGEVGQSKLMPYASLEAAKKDFEKKFHEKTKNSWAARENFIAQPGKYTLIEVQSGAGQEMEVALKVDGVDRDKVCKQRVLPCTLDKATQDLVSLIFSSDMFQDAMQTMNINVKKMPLGKLSKQQIARGFEVLEELEAALREQPSQAALLEDLSSRFYTIIPHNFGRARPPPINSPDLLRAKKDMLLVLADIEVAQSLQAQKVKEEEEVAHPLDQDYALLCCQLSLLDPASWEYQLIQNYVTQTGHKLHILNIWQVARDGEDERFKAHDLLENRRLLWHGTNVAVIAAILKSGLRIMPHSGGRVGRGIYFASENSKSACYVGCTSKKVGIMFLTEVALGKPYRITCDDPTLCQPPTGYDSVLACGQTEPDPAQDQEVLLDGRKVLVCQGKPIPMPAYKNSSFSQSEYLIYQESQCRIRYLVQLRF